MASLTSTMASSSSSVSGSAPGVSNVSHGLNPAAAPNLTPVLASPSSSSNQECASSSACTQLDALVSKHSFPEDLSKGLEAVKREEHEKRVSEICIYCTY